MQVILKKDVANLGHADEVVNVKTGYAVNYLVPQGFATVGTKSALKQHEETIRQRAHKEAKRVAEAEALAAKISSMLIKVAAKVSENGKIYGSVTASQLADALVAAGLEVDKKDVTMGRANNQATAILGNSVKALRENPRSKAILDSINILLLGKLNVSDREYFIKEYDLASEEQRLLDDSNKDESSLYKFILINRMQAKATKATITAPVPKSVRDSMLYKVVDTIEE